MNVNVMVITPEVAKEMLKFNTRNRKPNPNTVKQYAMDMMNGNWGETGDSVKFDVNGEMIDGQHRLMAICKAQIPIEMVVVTDLPVDAMKYIDACRRRSCESVYQILNGECPTSVFGVVRYNNHLREGRYQLEESNFSQQFSRVQQMEEYDSDSEGYNEALAFGKMINKNSAHGFTPVEVGAIYYYLVYDNGCNKELVKEFFNNLCDASRRGDNVFSKAVLAMCGNKSTRLRGEFRTKEFITCWNCFINNNIKRRKHYDDWFVIPTERQLLELGFDK